MPENKRQPSSNVLSILSQGELALEGRLPRSSNATFLVTCTLGTEQLLAVYKPHMGERPLWDFPGGLGRREVAAFRLSELLGWRCIPETVLVSHGPFGAGSLQHFVEADFAQHYFTLISDQELHDQLRRIAAFDLIANNADRKSGHCLIDSDRHLWGIDNGLCFHPENKLRTVFWDFGGQRLPAEVIDDLTALSEGACDTLLQLLTAQELQSLKHRCTDLITFGEFPLASEDHQCYPWPLV